MESLLTQFESNVSDKLLSIKIFTREYAEASTTTVEKKGNSDIYILGDESVGSTKLFFSEYLKAVVHRDASGNGYDITLYSDGKCSTYTGYKGNKVDGFYAKFNRDGLIQSLIVCENGKMTSNEYYRNESGELVKR